MDCKAGLVLLARCCSACLLSSFSLSVCCVVTSSLFFLVLSMSKLISWWVRNEILFASFGLDVAGINGLSLIERVDQQVR